MIYARQIPPEMQENPLFLFEEYPEGVTVTGNRDFKGNITEEYQEVLSSLENEECLDYIEEIENKQCYHYKNKTDCIMDYFRPKHKVRYSPREIKEFVEIVKDYNTCDRREEDYYICRVLSLITGDTYECAEIRGRCQGDWNNVFYPTNKYGEDFVKNFEIEYFNLGSEWVVHDEDTIPNSADEIQGYSMYCYSWNMDLIKKEIAEQMGVNENEVKLYMFDGYTKTIKYEEIDK